MEKKLLQIMINDTKLKLGYCPELFLIITVTKYKKKKNWGVLENLEYFHANLHRLHIKTIIFACLFYLKNISFI